MKVYWLEWTSEYWILRSLLIIQIAYFSAWRSWSRCPQIPVFSIMFKNKFNRFKNLTFPIKLPKFEDNLAVSKEDEGKKSKGLWNLSHCVHNLFHVDMGWTMRHSYIYFCLILSWLCYPIEVSDRNQLTLNTLKNQDHVI